MARSSISEDGVRLRKPTHAVNRVPEWPCCRVKRDDLASSTRAQAGFNYSEVQHRLSKSIASTTPKYGIARRQYNRQSRPFPLHPSFLGMQSTVRRLASRAVRFLRWTRDAEYVEQDSNFDHR